MGRVSALIYLLVGGMSGVLGLKAWREDRGNRIRQDFMLLASLTMIAYLAFSVYLAPGIADMRFLWVLSASFLPVATLQFLDHFFPSDSLDNSTLLRRLWLTTPLVSLSCVATGFFFFRDPQVLQVPVALLGVYTYACFVLVLHRLWEMHQGATIRLERARIRYLLVLLGASIAPSMLEGSARILQRVPDAAALDFFTRTWALQGGIPPIGPLFAGLLIFALSQVIDLDRLLDLHEILARVTTVMASGLLLVVMQVTLLYWLGGAPGALHRLYLLFLSALLFIILYDPFRRRIQPLIVRSLNRRGHQLSMTLAEVEQILPRVVSKESLARELIRWLHASGRFSTLALYIHDPDRRQMRLVESRTSGGDLPLSTAAIRPFGDAFVRGVPAFIRGDLERARGGGPMAEETAARLRTMDAMQADIVLPMMSGEIVLGWLAARELEHAEGFTKDEIHRIGRTMGRAAVVLENLKGFENLKEQTRLAALGTMAAGLAHEIRNPLAGIKGAAQYLQAVQDPDDAEEFLQVITTEVDRLNQVVSSFLDYARPFELHRSATDVNEVVAQVLSLVRAQGVPEGIQVQEALVEDLPSCDVDSDKIAQVLLNLVHNALQAVGSEGRIQIRTARTNLRGQNARGTHAVEIAVVDNGPGIPREDREKLFIPFFTTKPRGTGLGLPICQRIIRAHNGELEVRSAPDKGSRFTVRLPLATTGP